MNQNYTFRFHRNGSKGISSLVQAGASLDDAVAKFNKKPSNRNTDIFEIKYQSRIVWKK